MSIAEWALLAVLIIAAVSAAGAYFSHAYQGGLRNAVESISQNPYLPGSSSGSTTTTLQSTQTEGIHQEAPGTNAPTVTVVESQQTTTIQRNEQVSY